MYDIKLNNNKNIFMAKNISDAKPTSFRLTAEERDLLKQIAKINRRSGAQTVQVWIEQEAKRLNLKPSPPKSSTS